VADLIIISVAFERNIYFFLAFFRCIFATRFKCEWQ